MTGVRQGSARSLLISPVRLQSSDPSATGSITQTPPAVASQQLGPGPLPFLTDPSPLASPLRGPQRRCLDLSLSPVALQERVGWVIDSSTLTPPSGPGAAAPPPVPSAPDQGALNPLRRSFIPIGAFSRSGALGLTPFLLRPRCRNSAATALVIAPESLLRESSESHGHFGPCHDACPPRHAPDRRRFCRAVLLVLSSSLAFRGADQPRGVIPVG
jgi:hypothetical protein